MKLIPASIEVEAQSTKWALCWYVRRMDGVELRSTNSDKDITISGLEQDSGSESSGSSFEESSEAISQLARLNGVYEASSAISGTSIRSNNDLAVDNMEVMGTLTGGISAADIEAGLYDDAEVVIFIVNWEDTSGIVVLRCGNLGQHQYQVEGQYTAELRGLTQKLQQIIGRTYGKSCDADLGDSRCKFNIGSLTVQSVVFDLGEDPFVQFVDPLLEADTDSGSDSASESGSAQSSSGRPAGWYTFGLVTFTSGINSGFRREVRRHTAGGHIELVEALPSPIQPGDQYSIYPGCNKDFDSHCKGKFNNGVNFRGFKDIPGIDELLKGSTRS